MVDWESECRAAWDKMSSLSSEVKEAFIAGFKIGYHSDKPNDLSAYKEWKKNE